MLARVKEFQNWAHHLDWRVQFAVAMVAFMGAAVWTVRGALDDRRRRHEQAIRDEWPFTKDEWPSNRR